MPERSASTRANGARDAEGVVAMSDELGMYEGIITTRNIRRYRYDEPIPPEALNKMFFAATRGPSPSIE